MNSSILKGLTLLSFLTLIILFLLYRTGNLRLDSQKEQSSLRSFNDDLDELNITDTLIPKKDSGQKLILPSSKSIILAEEKATFLDSLLKKKSKSKYSKTKNRDLIFSGSKSGPVVNPTYFKNLIDSSKIDTIKK